MENVMDYSAVERYLEVETGKLDESRIDGLRKAFDIGLAHHIRQLKMDASECLKEEQYRREHFLRTEDMFDFTNEEKSKLELYKKYTKSDALVSEIDKRQEEIRIEKDEYNSKRSAAISIAQPRLQAFRETMKPEYIAFLNSGSEWAGVRNLRVSVVRHLFGILKDSECSYLEFQRNTFNLNPTEREWLSTYMRGDGVNILDAPMLYSAFLEALSFGEYRENGPAALANTIKAQMAWLEKQGKEDARTANKRLGQMRETKTTIPNPFQ